MEQFSYLWNDGVSSVVGDVGGALEEPFLPLNGDLASEHEMEESRRDGVAMDFSLGLQETLKFEKQHEEIMENVDDDDEKVPVVNYVVAASHSLIEDLLVSPCAKTMPYESIVFEDPEVDINAKQTDPLDSHRKVDAAVVHIVVKGALLEPKIEDTKEVYISFHSAISNLDVENTKDEIVGEYWGTFDIFEPPNKVWH